MGCFAAAPSGLATLTGPPFSRSYGGILPSSLAGVLPRASGSSPRLPVSVSVRAHPVSLAAFPGSVDAATSVLNFPRHRRSGLKRPISRTLSLAGLDGHFQPPAAPVLLRPRFTQTTVCGTGISTGCPSPTPFGLSLGPDLPWVDDPCPGTLRLSAAWIPTMLLATHAGIRTSAPSTAPSGAASPAGGTLPYHPRKPSGSRRSAASVTTLAPFIVGAGALDQ